MHEFRTQETAPLNHSHYQISHSTQTSNEAFQYLTRTGCQFLVTGNGESTFPSADIFQPGAGAISAPLRFALETDLISIGEPAKTMLDCIQAKVKSIRNAR
ncbi:uncharacterized protein EDB91DRAFT_123486 [Suillus paluster]|uniref:uncharacterized protein n=1 Tax=Suillus paluster TaxID=48578 RepID=UPI001B864DF9|nr:uncharacterized protein EDB91DRAFT_123486 [Suillus paluster]KAG1724631.1 hypothetical protein EDB91DRAFT_123486 [Suillus paluster]